MSGVRLTDAMPELANEIRELLLRRERPDLAGQVDHLRIVDRCRCGRPFCATFHADVDGEVPVVGGVDGSVPLGAERGLLVVDVLDGRVTTVEALFREDVRSRLHELAP